MFAIIFERRRSHLRCLVPQSLPCWAKPLWGTRISYVVGVRYPDPVKDTHLSYQLILPPLSTGPNQTLTEDLSISCYPSDLLLKSGSPLKSNALNDGRTILICKAEILRTI